MLLNLGRLIKQCLVRLIHLNSEKKSDKITEMILRISAQVMKTKTVAVETVFRSRFSLAIASLAESNL